LIFRPSGFPRVFIHNEMIQQIVFIVNENFLSEYDCQFFGAFSRGMLCTIILSRFVLSPFFLS
jgi:hypothetical protein